MKRIKLIAGITLLLALLPAAFASASPPINATGTIHDEEIVFLGIEPQGSNCILRLESHFRMEGTIEAMCIEAFQTTVHAPCDDLPPPGGGKEKWTMHAQCEGTVAGHSGPFTFDGVAQVRPDREAKGRAVLSGTGELSNMQGVLFLSPSPPEGGSYEGFVHFSQP
jgi:hypothetical protein